MERQTNSLRPCVTQSQSVSALAVLKEIE